MKEVNGTWYIEKRCTITCTPEVIAADVMNADVCVCVCVHKLRNILLFLLNQQIQLIIEKHFSMKTDPFLHAIYCLFF